MEHIFINALLRIGKKTGRAKPRQTAVFNMLTPDLAEPNIPNRAITIAKAVLPKKRRRLTLNSSDISLPLVSGMLKQRKYNHT